MEMEFRKGDKMVSYLFPILLCMLDFTPTVDNMANMKGKQVV